MEYHAGDNAQWRTDSTEPNLVYEYNEVVNDYFYADATERSEMCYFATEVLEGIQELEEHANHFYTKALYTPPGLGQRGCDKVKKGRFCAELLEPTPFESETGDLHLLSEGIEAKVIDGYFNSEAGEPVLHLEYITDEGVTLRAMCPYSRIAPVMHTEL